ncbi:hypothetical protein Taro_025683 [Colocasia esculenta]|uniref:Uncharacterized protein n=1 Tax=Colocasia esculenta TaxID=4460 RepID=A0A843V9H9_COLES|nr:hypothetical protein [Colocasia esculenta]
MSPPRTARHEHDPCTNGATTSSARPPQHGGGTPKPPEAPRGREKERGKGEARERGKGLGARALSPDPVKATYHPVATGTRRGHFTNLEDAPQLLSNVQIH